MAENFSTDSETPIIPESANLFSKETLSTLAFQDILQKKIARREGRSKDGLPWRTVVEDFYSRIGAGEIGLRISPGEDIRYGYYELYDSDGKRLGNMPEVILPSNFWVEKGSYLYNTIAEMLVDVMDISKQKMLDENRLKGEPELAALIANDRGILERRVSKN